MVESLTNIDHRTSEHSLHRVQAHARDIRMAASEGYDALLRTLYPIMLYYIEHTPFDPPITTRTIQQMYSSASQALHTSILAYHIQSHISNQEHMMNELLTDSQDTPEHTLHITIVAEDIDTASARLRRVEHVATRLFASIVYLAAHVEHSVQHMLEPVCRRMSSSSFDTYVCSNDSPTSLNCPICLLDVRDSTYCKLPCGHGGHESCMREWFTQKCQRPECPNCRTLLEDANDTYDTASDTNRTHAEDE